MRSAVPCTIIHSQISGVTVKLFAKSMVSIMMSASERELGSVKVPMVNLANAYYLADQSRREASLDMYQRSIASYPDLQLLISLRKSDV